ncbi:transforming acidic coiled-coil-containing protein 2 [Conger conger]|uniref:transforming acidic coiled-coil-containing protein 2 n=1 Tax=Conger conger TaxID=82655 RepID=UPI002A599882|nr:transforming acidic coiled-coil-containing protein 2 [Conger conger]
MPGMIECEGEEGRAAKAQAGGGDGAAESGEPQSPANTEPREPQTATAAGHPDVPLISTETVCSPERKIGASGSEMPAGCCTRTPRNSEEERERDREGERERERERKGGGGLQSHSPGTEGEGEREREGACVRTDDHGDISPASGPLGHSIREEREVGREGERVIGEGEGDRKEGREEQILSRQTAELVAGGAVTDTATVAAPFPERLFEDGRQTGPPRDVGGPVAKQQHGDEIIILDVDNSAEKGSHLQPIRQRSACGPDPLPSLSPLLHTEAGHHTAHIETTVLSCESVPIGATQDAVITRTQEAAGPQAVSVGVETTRDPADSEKASLLSTPTSSAPSQPPIGPQNPPAEGNDQQVPLSRCLDIQKEPQSAENSVKTSDNMRDTVRGRTQVAKKMAVTEVRKDIPPQTAGDASTIAPGGCSSLPPLTVHESLHHPVTECSSTLQEFSALQKQEPSVGPALGTTASTVGPPQPTKQSSEAEGERKAEGGGEKVPSQGDGSKEAKEQFGQLGTVGMVTEKSAEGLRAEEEGGGADGVHLLPAAECQVADPPKTEQRAKVTAGAEEAPKPVGAGLSGGPSSAPTEKVPKVTTGDSGRSVNDISLQETCPQASLGSGDSAEIDRESDSPGADEKPLNEPASSLPAPCLGVDDKSLTDATTASPQTPLPVQLERVERSAEVPETSTAAEPESPAPGLEGPDPALPKAEGDTQPWFLIRPPMPLFSHLELTVDCDVTAVDGRETQRPAEEGEGLVHDARALEGLAKQARVCGPSDEERKNTSVKSSCLLTGGQQDRPTPGGGLSTITTREKPGADTGSPEQEVQVENDIQAASGVGHDISMDPASKTEAAPTETPKSDPLKSVPGSVNDSISSVLIKGCDPSSEPLASQPCDVVPLNAQPDITVEPCKATLPDTMAKIQPVALPSSDPSHSATSLETTAVSAQTDSTSGSMTARPELGAEILTGRSVCVGTEGPMGKGEVTGEKDGQTGEKKEKTEYQLGGIGDKPGEMGDHFEKVKREGEEIGEKPKGMGEKQGETGDVEKSQSGPRTVAADLRSLNEAANQSGGLGTSEQLSLDQSTSSVAAAGSCPVALSQSDLALPSKTEQRELGLGPSPESRGQHEGVGSGPCVGANEEGRDGSANQQSAETRGTASSLGSGKQPGNFSDQRGNDGSTDGQDRRARMEGIAAPQGASTHPLAPEADLIPELKRQEHCAVSTDQTKHSSPAGAVETKTGEKQAPRSEPPAPIPGAGSSGQRSGVDVKDQEAETLALACEDKQAMAEVKEDRAFSTVLKESTAKPVKSDVFSQASEAVPQVSPTFSTVAEKSQPGRGEELGTCGSTETVTVEREEQRRGEKREQERGKEEAEKPSEEASIAPVTTESTQTPGSGVTQGGDTSSSSALLSERAESSPSAPDPQQALRAERALEADGTQAGAGPEPCTSLPGGGMLGVTPPEVVVTSRRELHDLVEHDSVTQTLLQDSKSATESHSQTEPATVSTSSESHSQTEPASESHSQTEPASESHSQTEPASESHSQTEPASERHSQTEPASESHSQTEAAREKHSQTEAASGSSDPDGGSQTQPASESHSQTQPASEDTNWLIQALRDAAALPQPEEQDREHGTKNISDLRPLQSLPSPQADLEFRTPTEELAPPLVGQSQSNDQVECRLSLTEAEERDHTPVPPPPPEDYTLPPPKDYTSQTPLPAQPEDYTSQTPLPAQPEDYTSQTPLPAQPEDYTPPPPKDYTPQPSLLAQPEDYTSQTPLPTQPEDYTPPPPKDYTSQTPLPAQPEDYTPPPPKDYTSQTPLPAQPEDYTPLPPKDYTSQTPLPAQLSRDSAQFPTPPPTPPERCLPTPPPSDSPETQTPTPAPPTPEQPPVSPTVRSEGPAAPCSAPPEEAPHRSSDSDGAFETPESTTPVKAAAPPLPPPEPDTEPQPPPSEDAGPVPEAGCVAEVCVSEAVSESPAPRALHRSVSTVFDEDKPIASSGAYNLDAIAAAAAAAETAALAALAGRDPTSPEPRRSPLTRSLSLQAGDLDAGPPETGPAGPGADLPSRQRAEAFSVETESAPGTLRKTKKPRPGSLKKKPPLARQNSTPPGTGGSPGPAAELGRKESEDEEGGSFGPSPKGTLRKNKATPKPDPQESVSSREEAKPPPPPASPPIRRQPSPPAPSAAFPPVLDEESPILPKGSYNWDPENFEGIDPFRSGGSRISNSPVLGRKGVSFTPVNPAAELPVTPDVPPPAPPPAPAGSVEEQPLNRRLSVRLEFDYSEESESPPREAVPPPKKLGKKPGAKMPLRKPKTGAKKPPQPPPGPLDNGQPPDSDEIPIPKATYNFDPNKWEDPNFNPFCPGGGLPNSPRLSRPAYAFDPDGFADSVDPFKSSKKMGNSPPKSSSASFDVSANDNDSLSELEDQNQNKPAKKKKAPIKSNTFRVKKSPKRSPVSETASQDDHATDEEKLASSSSQKWATRHGVEAELTSDPQDYPQPSDLTAFVNENSLPPQQHVTDYEIEYMEKIGSSTPPLSVKKPSLYLKLDSVADPPSKSSCVRGSEPSSPCTGSFEEMEAQISAGGKSPVLSSRGGLDPMGAEKSRKRESESLSLVSGSERDAVTPPPDPEDPADTPLLDRLSESGGPLQYLEPDLAETNPTAFAQKLQEELVLAALRIEALQVAQKISQSPSLSCVIPEQKQVMTSADPVSKGPLYSRPGYSEGVGGSYLPPDLDHSLGIAREEIVAKEQEVVEWQRKYEESRQEVVEMRRIVAEYEKTIAQMIEDEQREKSLSHHTIQQLILEKDQALADLNSVEKSLADLFRRYEKMKDVLEGFRKNEEVLKKCAQEYLSRVRKEEQRYQALKIHAEEKLDKANADIAQVRAKAKQEQAASQASLRKEQMKVDSLERTLEQKNKEIEELTKICDELISKMGKS